MDDGLEAGICFVGAHGNSSKVLEIAKEILDQVPPAIHHFVDLQRHRSARALSDAHRGVARVHSLDYPVRIEGLVGQQGPKINPLNQRLHADGIKAISG